MAPPSELPTGTLTLLFTDIEGSTSLLKDLGRDRYRDLLETHNRLIRSALAAHEGIEVDRQGDAFFAVFRSAGAALSAAARAQRALAVQEWPEAVTVRVRMGLHTGEAAVGDDGYVGVAVHHAARVGAAARGGQILLTSTTGSLVQHDLPVEGFLHDLGERRLAGFDQPERLFALELEGADATAGATHVPLRRERAPSARPLLEREAELAALQALVEACRSGDGHLVVVEGGAGIGKTSLLAEARRLASGFDVLTARAGELEGDFAFGIVRQLFEHRLAGESAGARAELLSGAAGLAAPLFAVTPGEADATTAEMSFAMLHGLYWLAANFALRQPTLVVVDDLHWADAPSLRWLGYLARRLEGLPLLLLLGTRPPEQAGAPDLVTEILSDPLATVIRPGALGLAATGTLAQVFLSGEPDPVFAAALRRASGGNPLYLTALLESVARRGIEPSAEQAPHLLELGGEAVSRGVSLRLSRLPAEAVALAHAAAILGDQTELRLAATLADLDATAALNAASALVRTDILQRESPLEFSHPVIRTAVLEGMSSGARMAAHRRAAELLLASGAPPEQAAGHSVLVLPAADAFITETLRQAARRAHEQGAPETAAVYLRRALAEPPPAPEIGDVLAELGDAEQLTGDPAAVEHFRSALASATDPEQAALLALRHSRALWLSGRFEESVEAARRPLDDAAPLPSTVREKLVCELIGTSWGMARFYPAAVVRLTEIREGDLSDSIGGDRLLAVLSEHAMRQGRDRRLAIDLALRSLASGRLAKMRDAALYSAAAVLIVAEETDRASELVGAALAAGRRHGDAVAVSHLISVRALLALVCGDLRAARRDVNEALELGRMLAADTTAIVASGRSARIAIESGDLDDAREFVTLIDPSDTRMPEALKIFLLTLRGNFHLVERRAREALADFEACGQAAQSIGFENPANYAWRSDAALALHALGERAPAVELAGTELSLAQAWGGPRAIGTALRALGLVEGGARGLTHLHEAVDALAGSAARLEHARALVELGAGLRRANQRSEARRQLREGIDLAHLCGATPLVERANDELAATGAHRRTVQFSGLDAVTVSERRVAQLAADGLSNKEIAQTLFVTVKTVEVHLSRVYRKLEIDSRRQLARALDAPSATTAGR